MRRLLRFVLRALLVMAVLAASVGLWKREEIARLLAVNSLFDAENIVHNFSHMDALFLTRPLSRGDGPVAPLPPGPPFALPAAAQDWIKARAITGARFAVGGGERESIAYPAQRG